MKVPQYVTPGACIRSAPTVFIQLNRKQLISRQRLRPAGGRWRDELKNDRFDPAQQHVYLFLPPDVVSLYTRRLLLSTVVMCFHPPITVYTPPCCCGGGGSNTTNAEQQTNVPKQLLRVRACLPRFTFRPRVIGNNAISLLSTLRGVLHRDS